MDPQDRERWREAIGLMTDADPAAVLAQFLVTFAAASDRSDRFATLINHTS